MPLRSGFLPTCFVILATLSAPARAQIGNLTFPSEPVVSIGTDAASLKDLGSVAVPQGLRLTLIAPTGNAYWIVAEVPESRVVCIVGVGSVVPFGYADGCG